MIDIYQLEHLIAIAKAGTLSKAAETLLISQPALTRSIQRLEDELDVRLFDRKKNRITLNDTGELTLQYAQKIVSDIEDMTAKIQKYAQSKQRIQIGACAPAPLWGMQKMIHNLYPEITTTVTLDSQASQLLDGLANHSFSLIVLNHPIENDQYSSVQLFDEYLYLSVPPAHPLALFKEISFQDLNGESVLLLSRIGLWTEICLKMIPESHLLIQQDAAVFNELTNASALPYFRTNITMSRNKDKNPRVSLRIKDKEACITFYAIYHKKDKHLFASLKNEVRKIEWDTFEAL